MCTAPVFASNVEFLRSTSGRLKFTEWTVPVMALPSYFISTATVLRSAGLGPQSPVQVPVNGSAAALPCSASSGMATAMQVKRQTIRNKLVRIHPPFSLTVGSQYRSIAFIWETFHLANAGAERGQQGVAPTDGSKSGGFLVRLFVGFGVKAHRQFVPSAVLAN